ncbi:MAG: aminotransferase class I/II-fold pyridoxal phosphate-dependent enzyme [Alphaproteobacteria bacterium]|nr:aminotransferase class I/II-fold pyridoxal phosphate-dependent enzyme [Alphaproteobacteria bacterium]MCW5742062.1 aminotransferase class I/II-fold pyridoxal phosphate-dependent enzyme [Alphaproteobacteria bacterium]
MGLFDRHAQLLDFYRGVQATGADPIGVTMERVLSPTEAIINGKRTLLVGTNNYFGLTFDPACIEAAVEATKAEGTGTTGSRILNGSYTDHKDLERELADFYGMKHCMVFTTGYQANLGLISTLVGEGDYLVIDADSHASIYDACKQTQATIIRFKHNDPASLEARLRRLDREPGNKLVVVEGIYSMLGDTAPLKEFVAVTKRHGAYIMVDEAHSLGALGEHGRGLVEEVGVLDQVDFVVGTFSKTLGAIGGFAVSNHDGFDVLRLTTRAYMFTASLPPSIVASVRAALRVVRARPELRTRLWANVATLYDGLADAGFQLGPQHGPVVAVQLPDLQTAIAMWRALLDEGIYVNIAGLQATPGGVPLLRCSLSAAHSQAQLEQVVDTFVKLGTAFGLLKPQKRAAVG